MKAALLGGWGCVSGKMSKTGGMGNTKDYVRMVVLAGLVIKERANMVTCFLVEPWTCCESKRAGGKLGNRFLSWATLWMLGLLTTIVIVRGEPDLRGNGILIFRYFAFDMLPGHPGRHAPKESWAYGSKTQRTFGLNMQIWQTVMKRWKLNSWDDVSQLGRADHVRREKSQKQVSVGLSTVGKKNVVNGTQSTNAYHK